MNSMLIEEYHMLVLDLMAITPESEWNRILERNAFDYKEAMDVIHYLLIEILTKYDKKEMIRRGSDMDLYISDLRWLISIEERI